DYAQHALNADLAWLARARLVVQAIKATPGDRPRQRPTVDLLHPNRAAIALLDSPSAAASTILQRKARAWAPLGRRAQRSSTSRSSLPSTTSARGGISASYRRR